VNEKMRDFFILILPILLAISFIHYAINQPAVAETAIPDSLKPCAVGAVRG
jgi:hypothetical protein